MNTEELTSYIDTEDIENLKHLFKKFKTNKPKMFTFYLDKLKLIFISANDISILNKIALLFKEFKIHSSVPLVVSKLISGNYNHEGGTLIYALGGLKKVAFREDLEKLWDRNISYEMEQMLLMIGIG